MCLYATARVAGLSFEEQLRGTAIFYIPLIITLIVITMVPQGHAVPDWLIFTFKEGEMQISIFLPPCILYLGYSYV